MGDLSLSAVRFSQASPVDVTAGFLGYVSFDLQNRIHLDGITVRRTAAGRLALSFPARRDRRGDEHLYIRPVDALARQDLERVIFAAIADAVIP